MVKKSQSVSSNEPKWYIIQTYSGNENAVVRSLTEMAKLYQLEGKFIEFLVPSETVTEIKGGQKKQSERKLFPGYVLVRMLLDDDTWHLVKKTPRVIGFVGGSGDRPAPISDAEANKIIESVQAGTEKPKPKVIFEPGEVVRVTNGPFADFNGVVEEVNYEKNRLRVAVLIFGRSTPVELEFGQVEKA